MRIERGELGERGLAGERDTARAAGFRQLLGLGTFRRRAGDRHHDIRRARR